MYTEVASKLVVKDTDPEYSQAVSMAGANGLEVEVTVFSNDAASGTLEIYVEGSNDLENWSATDISGSKIEFAAGTPPEMGSKSGQFHGIACQYVRLKYLYLSGTNTAVLAASVNTADL